MAKTSTSTQNSVSTNPYVLNTKTPTYTIMGKPLTSGQDITAADYNSYVNAIYEPQKRELGNTYNQTLGRATMGANNAGVLNSVGFQNYRANQLDKNYANSLNDAYGKAQLSAQDYINSLLTQGFQNDMTKAQGGYQSTNATTSQPKLLYGLF